MNNQTLRLVILPQALRVITPPLTSQYLNLTKNSSLAVAIGFPDLFNVGNYNDESNWAIPPIFCDDYDELSVYQLDDIRPI